MIELSGEGLNDKMTHVLQPGQAKKDEEMLRALELWEDEYHDAVLWGMPKLDDQFKITIVRGFLATENLQDKMEGKTYDNYNEARNFVVDWARPKAQKGVRKT